MGSGFLVWGAVAAAAAGWAIFLRRLSVVGALELSLCEGFGGPPGEVGRFRHGFWSAPDLALGTSATSALPENALRPAFAPVN